MKSNITVFEFDEISIGAGAKQLSPIDFSELKQFILPLSADDASNDSNTDTLTVKDASVCMTLGARNGREVLRVKNYVGTISLKSGTLIEILPKIADKATEEEIPFARRLVAEMLLHSGNVPYKSFQRADLDILKNMNLYEVYIRLFLDELAELYKRGLKAGYTEREDNENFLKGKLLFGEHVKRNFAHKEKFYVRYDVFDFNRPENRLIKLTLMYLKSKSNDENNRRDIRRMLLTLDEISPSVNIDGDFKACECGRSWREYADVLMLCDIFLRKSGFTPFGGKMETVALLFPMDRLFETYIAVEMSKVSAEHGYVLRAQDRGHYLFDEPKGKFPLRPDIVLRSETERKTIIIDTKWKRLYDNSSINYGISHADMYQMYAYHTRYDDVEKVVVLYPYYESLSLCDFKTHIGDKEVFVKIRMFDLKKYIESKLPFGDCIYHQKGV